VVPILVLSTWTLAPTAGIDSATNQEIANAFASFSLELLQVLASVNKDDDSQCTFNTKHHAFQAGLETIAMLHSTFQEASIFSPSTE
jgi:hypothetical protein